MNSSLQRWISPVDLTKIAGEMDRSCVTGMLCLEDGTYV